jgi:GxxExxY protein
VGDYAADLLVEDKVIVGLKVAAEYCTSAKAQLISELVSTGAKVGLLINFGRDRIQFQRLVH